MTRTSDRTGHRAGGAMSILMLLTVSAGLAAGTSRNVYASDSPTGVLIAEATPAPETNSEPTRADEPMAHVDARIATLHKQLQITAAQEPQFKAFADVMRSNAQAMNALFQERSRSTDNTAVTRLRWYAQLTEAHAEALKKLVPVFDALYQGLSEKQKATANTVFDEIRVRRPAHKAKQS